MKRLLPLPVALLLLSVAAGLTAQTASDSASPRSRLVGLEVFHPHPDKPTESLVAGRQPGTRAHLHLTAPGRTLIALDREACTLDAFVDDKGTVLSKPGPAGLTRHWLWPFPRFDASGQGCSLEVRSRRTPASGATRLHLKGTLVLVSGEDEQSAETRFKVEEGNTFDVGPLTFAVVEAKVIEWSGLQYAVTLATKADVRSIRDVAFRNVLGRKAEARRMGTSETGGVYTRTYGFREKHEMLTVQMTYFTRTEKVEVPFDIRTGVGLP